ncbi:MAG: hypothetical protein RIS84_1908 [Pseudomonadota bacterium]
MVIFWPKPARKDLKHIYQYIAQDSIHYATRVMQDIMDKVEILIHTPHMGHMVPEIGEPNVREIHLYSYRIMYEVMPDRIYVHSIIHMRRNFKPDDLKR